MSQAELLGMVHQAIDAVFLYAACTADGYVKVGISRVPFERVAAVNQGSPSPVRAAQWAWVGSFGMGREMERTIRREWEGRHCRGEWYRFDYSNPEDKRDFHDTLHAVYLVATGEVPKWKKAGPEDIAAMVRATKPLKKGSGQRKWVLDR